MTTSGQKSRDAAMEPIDRSSKGTTGPGNVVVTPAPGEVEGFSVALRDRIAADVIMRGSTTDLVGPTVVTSLDALNAVMGTPKATTTTNLGVVMDRAVEGALNRAEETAKAAEGAKQLEIARDPQVTIAEINSRTTIDVARLEAQTKLAVSEAETTVKLFEAKATSIATREATSAQKTASRHALVGSILSALIGLGAGLAAAVVNRGETTAAAGAPVVSIVDMFDRNRCKASSCTYCGSDTTRCIPDSERTACTTANKPLTIYTGQICELPALVKLDDSVDVNTQVLLTPWMLNVKPGPNGNANFELFLNRREKDLSGRPTIDLHVWDGAELLGATVQLVTFR